MKDFIVQVKNYFILDSKKCPLKDTNPFNSSKYLNKKEINNATIWLLKLKDVRDIWTLSLYEGGMTRLYIDKNDSYPIAIVNCV